MTQDSIFYPNKALGRFEALKELVLRGKEFGLDIDDLLSKIDSVIRAMSDRVVRIVLMGSFSDGKTSAIAGLLGQVKDNMKIDQDESSDDITIYRFDGIDNIEIIDTPGLFGTKEKEVDGNSVRYSDITSKYISEANIIVYVCDAVMPLKESHTRVIRKVLRDYGKLRSTIFVLNKMDEAGFDMLDPVDYERGASIKKEGLIRRLKETMELTEDEEKQLEIVCVAADPKGKGLEHWLSKKDAYLERSHIGLLQESIGEIVANSDVDKLKSETSTSVIKDIIFDVRDQLALVIEPLEKSSDESKEISAELVQDTKGLRKDLIEAKGRLLEDLRTLSTSIKTKIDEADGSTILSVVENNLGVSGEKVDYHILKSQIAQKISECVESNNYTISSATLELSQKMDRQGTIMKGALKKGAGQLGKVKVTNTQVLAARDFLGKYFNWARKIKFKPHGAGKLATKISKGAGAAGFLLSGGVEILDYLKEKKAAKKLSEFKISAKDEIESILKDVYDVLNSEDRYFEEFAPSYVEMLSLVKQRNRELEILYNQITLLRQYNDQINGWLTSAK